MAHLHPLWTLIPVSMLAGLAALWSFGRLSNQRAIRETKRRLEARLYEFRLFVDEPKLIWQALAGLVRDNFRYLALTLVPGAVVAIPMFFLLTQLDAFYGRAPLQPGQSALVTVQVKRPLRPDDPAPALALPDGFVAETPPVRVLERQQISWRVRPLRAVSGTLHVTIQGESLSERISAEPGLQRLAKGTSIQIDYPAASIDWVLWFFAISMATALLLRRRIGVSF